MSCLAAKPCWQQNPACKQRKPYSSVQSHCTHLAMQVCDPQAAGCNSTAPLWARTRAFAAGTCPCLALLPEGCGRHHPRPSAGRKVKAQQEYCPQAIEEISTNRGQLWYLSELTASQPCLLVKKYLQRFSLSLLNESIIKISILPLVFPGAVNSRFPKQTH